MNYEPVRSHNFSFSIPELDDEDAFRLAISSVKWSASPKRIWVSLRLFSDTPVVKCPWYVRMLTSKPMTGQLHIINSQGNDCLVYTFYDMKLIDQKMSFDYMGGGGEMAGVNLEFSYKNKSVK